MQAGRVLWERSVRDGILSRDDTVSFNVKKWYVHRKMSLSIWGKSK
jgi:hypothetical protein